MNKDVYAICKESFWLDFSKSSLASYLGIEKDDYYIMNDKLFIYRKRKHGNFSDVEKERIQWFFQRHYLDQWAMEVIGNKIVLCVK